jgi:hypothetical protein
MHLSPDQMIFWQHGFLQTQRHHCVHVGADACAGRRFKTDHTRGFPRAWNAPAGRTFWKSSSPDRNRLKRSV